MNLSTGLLPALFYREVGGIRSERGRIRPATCRIQLALLGNLAVKYY